MIRRQRFPKLPTQGNYYPMAESAYIEDKKFRLTVVTAQPLGVASMASGQLEVNQDSIGKSLEKFSACYKNKYKIYMLI